MSAEAITKSRRKLEAWADVRALDRIAVPLIAGHGLEQAYRMAAAQRDVAAQGTVRAGANVVRS